VFSLHFQSDCPETSKCYGFVTMSTAEEAAVAIRTLHAMPFDGAVIRVEFVCRLE
jgi:RNA recognition motif-containing protein